MSDIRILEVIKMGRLHFVMGGFLLFCFGALLALRGGAAFDPWMFIMGYSAVFAAHLSVSYSNDYFDYEADAHVTPTPFSGGSGVLRAHPDLRPAALAIAIILSGFSVSVSLIFIWLFSFTPWFLVLILAGLGLGWSYTAPPFRLAYRGFGEPSTVFSLGFMLPVSGYLIIKGSLDINILMFSAVFLVYGLMFILSVQIPDSEGDARAGKRTMIVRFGRKTGMKIAVASAMVATFGFAVLDSMGKDAFVLTVLSFLPLSAAILGRDLVGRKAPASVFTNLSMTALILMVLLSDIYLITNL